MFTTPNARLLEWVRKFKVDLTPEGSITRLELWHAVEGEMGERLATLEMADREDDEDPDDLAQEIWNIAEDDAATRAQGSYQRYIVQAYRGDTREPDEQKAFTTTGKCVSAILGASTEPPTPRGELSQAMRERNDLHGLLVRVMEHSTLNLGTQLEKERAQVDRLREVGFQYEKLRQEQLDRSNERAIALEEAKATSAMMQGLMGMLLQYAPLVLNRLLAAPAPASAALPLQPAPTAPQPAPPPNAVASSIELRDAAIYTLLGSMTPDQLPAVMGAFTDEQKAQFVKVYQSYREHPPSPAATSAANSTPN